MSRIFGIGGMRGNISIKFVRHPLTVQKRYPAPSADKKSYFPTFSPTKSQPPSVFFYKNNKKKLQVVFPVVTFAECLITSKNLLFLLI